MSEVRIIATVIAKENEVAYVRAAAESIVKSSHQEEG
ncbi:antibiotic biosynthesis monooxygenase, partial [Vibrio parahaemolyticus]